jgi:enoyl-CoA hydratase/carnithine racemase
MERTFADFAKTLTELRLSHAEGVATVRIATPGRANALSLSAFEQLRAAFDYLGSHPDVRVVVLSADGKHFCSGIDTAAFETLLAAPGGTQCAGRKNAAFYASVRSLQEAVSSLERCRVPVIAAIHGACLGGGVDLITAADVRFSTADAQFGVIEAELGFAADLGTLCRLHRLVGEGRARDLALTCRRFSGTEAFSAGLVSAALDSREELEAEVARVAAGLAARSPLAMVATKAELLYAREHSVSDALEHVAWRNAATLASEDLARAMAARGRGGRGTPAVLFSRL